MKKLLSILLAVLLLGGIMTVGLSAAAAPNAQAPGIIESLLLKPLTDFLNNYDLANLTGAQTDTLIGILNTLKTLGIDYTAILQAAETYLSAAAKEALRLAGLMDFPAGDQGKATNSSALKTLTDFIGKYDLSDLSDAQITVLIGILTTLKSLGIDYKPVLASIDQYLPFSTKAALHDAGLMNYPIWERSAMWYFVFRYLLFGWLWMEQGQSAGLLLSLFGL